MSWAQIRRLGRNRILSNKPSISVEVYPIKQRDGGSFEYPDILTIRASAIMLDMLVKLQDFEVTDDFVEKVQNRCSFANLIEYHQAVIDQLREELQG